MPFVFQASCAQPFTRSMPRLKSVLSAKNRLILVAAAYATSCALAVLACVAIALSPRNGAGYTLSTLFYTFTLGMAAATITAMVLAIIGDTAAATKINLFFALNTLFSLGMLRVNGWAHDAWKTNGMLYTEALVGVAALGIFMLLAGKVRG